LALNHQTSPRRHRGKDTVGVVLIRFDIVSTSLAEEAAKRIVALEGGGRGLFAVLERASVRIRRMPD
jgi:hypothetical protein